MHGIAENSGFDPAESRKGFHWGDHPVLVLLGLQWWELKLEQLFHLSGRLFEHRDSVEKGFAAPGRAVRALWAALVTTLLSQAPRGCGIQRAAQRGTPAPGKGPCVPRAVLPCSPGV